MNKQDWYEDRILWRAERHKLFHKRCTRFSELPDFQQQYVQSKVVLTGRTILIFFQDERTWTLLTTNEIATCHGDGIFCGFLDQIDKAISLWSESDLQPSDKHTANYLALSNLGFKIWAPEGNELHALWNILMMFPIQGGLN